MSHPKLSRRDLLKMLAAATGAATISTLPNKWVTPIVGIGALPAHAQGSLRGTIQVTVNDLAGRKPKPPNPAILCSFATVTVPSLSLSHCFDTTGTFSFTNIPTGDYTVRCEISGCGFLPDQIAHVVAPGTASVTFNFSAC